jgi:hypothetical protein
MPAVVEADCAPWDGAAFTLSIPFDTGRLARISIYQAPDIQRRVTFSFPDPTGHVGSAFYHPEFGEDAALGGTVTFESVQKGVPVQGKFDLLSTAGLRLRGRFDATWVDRRALCG